MPELIGNIDIISFIVALAAALGVVYMVRKKDVGLPIAAQFSSDSLAKTVAQLSASLTLAQEKIQDLDAELLSTKTELMNTKSELMKGNMERERMKLRIDELEAALSSINIQPGRGSCYPPLLAIFGPDERISGRDILALKRSGMDYLRIMPASMSEILAKLRSSRKDGCAWRYVHISSHGGIFKSAGPAGQDVTGIYLASDDGTGATVAPVSFFSDAFATGEVAVMLLASCSSSELADELAGIVQTVIYFNEGVPNQDAEDFTEAFWRRVNQGLSPGQAYLESRKEVPGVKDYVFIRQPMQPRRVRH
jgi:hypothetical protein